MYTDPNRAYYVTFSVRKLPGSPVFEGLRPGGTKEEWDKLEADYRRVIEEKLGISGFKVERSFWVATLEDLDRLGSGDLWTSPRYRTVTEQETLEARHAAWLAAYKA